jgi:hypothetical protein
MKKLIVMGLLAGTMAVGCGKGGGGGGGAGNVPAAFKEFGGMDTAKWQGAWVTGRDIGQAWEVKGSTLTTWDGATEEAGKLLTIVSPCAVKATKTSKDGMRESYTYSAVWDGDTLYLGMGAAGVKAGDAYIVCGMRETYVFKGGKCEAWKEEFMREGEWKSGPAECKVEGDTFTVPGDWGITAKIAGNVVLSDQMQGNKAEKTADYAAAKAKVTK